MIISIIFAKRQCFLVQISLHKIFLRNIVFLTEEFLQTPSPIIDSTSQITLLAIYDKLTELHDQIKTYPEALQRIYDNKALMSLLGIKDRHLKRLRDNGILGYSRHGDKYWYTQADVDRFLSRCHNAAFGHKSLIH